MGHRIVIKATYRYVLVILFKGLDHLAKGNIVGSSMDYDLLIQRDFAKVSLLLRDMTVLYSKGDQSGSTLEVYMCRCVVFSYFSLRCYVF